MAERVGIVRRVYRKLLYSNLEKIYGRIASLPQKEMQRRRFLDVGSGLSFDVMRKTREGYAAFGIEVEADKAVKSVSSARKHGMDPYIVVGDAQNLPFKDGMFDSILCRHVIEHVPDDAGTLKEIKRIMKNAAVLDLIVPNLHNWHTTFHTWLRLPDEERFTDRTHLREYTREHLLELLSSVGFKTRKIAMRGFNPPVGMKVLNITDPFSLISTIRSGLGKLLPKYSAEIYTEVVKN